MSEDDVVKALRQAHPLPTKQRRFSARALRATTRVSAVLVLSYLIVGIGTLAWGFVSGPEPQICETDAVTCQAGTINAAARVVADAAVWPRYWGAEMRNRFEAQAAPAPMSETNPSWPAGAAPH